MQTPGHLELRGTLGSWPELSASSHPAGNGVSDRFVTALHVSKDDREIPPRIDWGYTQTLAIRQNRGRGICGQYALTAVVEPAVLGQVEGLRGCSQLPLRGRAGLGWARQASPVLTLSHKMIFSSFFYTPKKGVRTAFAERVGQSP